MIIKGLIILSSVAFAQGPEYTGDIKQKPSKTEQRVNENIVNTNKKIEIEGLKKSIELKKDAPKNLQADPATKKKTPFMVHPQPSNPQDPAAYKDQYDHGIGNDPSTEFEQEVIDSRRPQPVDMTNEEYIRQFKENAARAGIKVEVDPKTMKARPVKDGGSNQ